MNALNEAQLQAVTEGDGPTLVLAGAGTGKTLVIIERLAWLVRERGVPPRNLLALTFTNRAAAQMRARFMSRLEGTATPAWLGTFHSFGLLVLRREIHRLGRENSFTVFDEADQLALMKQLIQNLPPKWLRVSPREALQWMSKVKQNLARPDPATPCATEEGLLTRICAPIWALGGLLGSGKAR